MGYGGYSIEWYCWIWGFVSVRISSGYYGTYGDSQITTNDTLLTVSIISTIMIAIGIVILLVGGVQERRSSKYLAADRLYNKRFEIISGIGAILLIVGAIVWLAGADWPTTDSVPPIPGYDFWDLFNVNFGIVTPFIGAGISLVGIPVSYYYNYYLREKAGIREPKRETTGDKETLRKKPTTLRFCPECGKKIEQEGVTFCPSCGFKF